MEIIGLLLLAAILWILFLIALSSSNPKKKRREEDLLDEIKWQNDDKTPEEISQLREKKANARWIAVLIKAVFLMIFIGFAFQACFGE